MNLYEAAVIERSNYLKWFLQRRKSGERGERGRISAELWAGAAERDLQFMFTGAHEGPKDGSRYPALSLVCLCLWRNVWMWLLQIVLF